MVGRFPIATLFLEMPSEQVDVNVHPAKREIRITQEHDLYQAVYRSVSTSLQSLTAAPVFAGTSAESFSSSGGVKEAVEAFYEKNSNLFSRSFSPTKPFQQTEEIPLAPERLLNHGAS